MIQLGRFDSVKKLGFGTMRLPLTDPDNVKSIDYEQFKAMVDHYMAAGMVYFDTAYPYHEECSEIAVRECLVKRYPRDSFLLADKMPIIRVTDSADYEKYFNEQLERCGVKYFDFYLLHNMGRDRYVNTKKFGGFEFISELKEKGLVKNIGFSFHDDADTLDMILSEHPEVDFVQLQINYLDWEGAVAQSGACYEVAKKHGKPVIVMEPVKGGTLANLPDPARKAYEEFYLSTADDSQHAAKNVGSANSVHAANSVDAASSVDTAAMPSPASLAIRFAASLDNVILVLSGMSDINQLKDNVGYMKDFIPLSDDEKELVNKITSILKEAIKISCTSCRYCMEVCPKDIYIPALFGLYNLHCVTGKKTGMYYNRFITNHGKASDCIKCGQCENICPQHIAVRDWLCEVANLYE